MTVLFAILALAAIGGIIATVRAVLTDGYGRVPTDPARVPDVRDEGPAASGGPAARVHVEQARDMGLGIEVPRAVGRLL
jgi:hypothetical protein